MNKQSTLLLFLIFSLKIVFSQEKNCAYIVLDSGATVMSKPDINSQAYYHLAYGTVVRIVENSDSTIHQVKFKGKSHKGRWVKINHGYVDCDDVVFDGPDQFYETPTVGYVLDTWTSKQINKIPVNSLYHYYSLHLNSMEYRIEYPNEREKYTEDIYTSFKNAKYKCCYPNYAPNKERPMFYMRAKEEWPVMEQRIRKPNVDTLKSYFTLELVNEKSYKKVKNPYSIDTTSVHRVVTVRGPENHNDLGSFYLYLDEKRDSLLITDHDGEYYIPAIFSGQIQKLNTYLVNFPFEESYYRLYDKTTGQKLKRGLNGIPYISPDGKYMVNFNCSLFTEVGCLFEISTIADDSLQISSLISIQFKSWATSLEFDSSFWISDRELIMKAYPIDYYYSGEDPPSYQYLKLTLLLE